VTAALSDAVPAMFIERSVVSYAPSDGVVTWIVGAALSGTVNVR
jgi:hypothetical protein